MAGLTTTDPIALALLMTDDLYRIENEAPPPLPQVVVAEPPAFHYLGENNAWFLVLVSDEHHPVADAATIDALERILKGKKMELRDVALLNVARHASVRFEHYREFFACNKLVLFGIPPQQIGLPAFGSNEISEHLGVKILPTYSFPEMAADEQKKRLFWNEMKKI